MDLSTSCRLADTSEPGQRRDAVRRTRRQRRDEQSPEHTLKETARRTRRQRERSKSRAPLSARADNQNSSFSSRSAALILGSPFLSFSPAPSVQAWPSLIGCPTAISLAPLRLAERGAMPVFGAKSKMPMPQRNPAWHIGLRPRTCRHARRPWRRSERGEGEGAAGFVVINVGGVKIKENPDYQHNSAAHEHLITH